jgi:hypothetical protein
MIARSRTGRGAGSWVWLAILPAAALAETTEDIRDIRGPKELPVSWMLPAMLGAAIALALGCYLLWHRRRRTVARPTLSLAALTLQRLDATRALMRADTARAFGIAASEVIRSYIEKRFDIVAMQRTTEEFLQTLLQRPDDVLAQHRTLLADFLQQCDLVKFAGDSLALADMESLYQSARRFVLQTSGSAVA